MAMTKVGTEYSKKTKLVTERGDQLYHVDTTRPVHEDSGSGDYLNFYGNSNDKRSTESGKIIKSLFKLNSRKVRI